MAGPFDYTIQQPDFNPLAGFASGLEVAQGINQFEAQRAEMQRKQQQAMELRAVMSQMRPDMSAVEFAGLARQYPLYAETLKKQYDTFSDVKKTAIFDSGMPAFALLQPQADGKIAGVEQAAARLRASAQAFAAAGDQGMAKEIGDFAAMIEADPAAGRMMLGGYMSVTGGPKFEQYAKSMSQFATGEKTGQETAAIAEKRPFELAQEKAEATTKGVTAKFAEPKALLDLEKSGWDIQKIKNDINISRQTAQIAAMNAAIAREGNTLKRQELGLKVAELEDKVNVRIQERAAEGREAQFQANTLLDSVERAINAAAEIDPKTGKITGFTSVARNATGPIQGRMPTLFSDKVADFESVIEDIGSQTVMANLGKMKGVLSDSDLKVLRGAMGSLDLKQSPASLVSKLQQIQTLTKKAKEAAAERYGAPANAPADRPPLSAFVRR